MRGGVLREQSSDSHQERRPRRLAAAVRRTTRRQQCASVSHLDEMDDKKAAWVRAYARVRRGGKWDRASRARHNDDESKRERKQPL